MIVRDEEDEHVMVTQTDHAHFAADVMRLWRHGKLAEHPRRHALLGAIRQHDNGWREADAAPRADRESGRPLDFTEVPADLRAEIWRRGILRYRREDPYVALLVLRHARALHDTASGPVASVLEELDEAAETWREEAGVGPEEIESDYRWLALADTLSLVAANRWLDRRSVHGYDLRWSGERVEIAPFPLAGTTRFPLSLRRIPRRRYESDRDLAVELATTHWEREDVRLAPEG